MSKAIEPTAGRKTERQVKASSPSSHQSISHKPHEEGALEQAVDLCYCHKDPTVHFPSESSSEQIAKTDHLSYQ